MTRLPVINSLCVPGRPEQVAATREFVGRVLGVEHPAVEGAVLLTSELVTNSVRHSASGQEGGKITVTVTEAPGEADDSPGFIRVEVADDGAAGAPEPRAASEGDESGYGLRLVDTLAVRWGSYGDQDGATTWFEIA